MPSAQYFASTSQYIVYPTSFLSFILYTNVISSFFSEERVRLRKKLSENVCFLHKHEELNLDIQHPYIKNKQTKETLHMTVIQVPGVVGVEIGRLLSSQGS